MVAVEAFCDRCGELVRGMEVRENDVLIGTAGFYRVDTGIWNRYAYPHECIICDKCMQNDDKYRQDYDDTQKEVTDVR